MRALRMLAMAVCLLAPAVSARAAGDTSDPRATAIADQVMQALGGADRWAKLPCLGWDFAVSVRDTVRSTRHHVWDKFSGRHRVDGVMRDGTPYVVVHTVGDTLHGSAWLGGRALTGDSLHTFIKRGEALWVNDTYWMLMPYKLRDPGAFLDYDGEAREDGNTYDKLAMHFGQVGLTPGDRYWVYVNRANHRVEKWSMVLEGQTDGPKSYTWEGWEEHGNLWFPTAHRQGDTAILTNAVRTLETVPAGVFDHP